MNNYCVYKHTSPSGKVYIGQTNNYERRCKEHFVKHKDCPAFGNAIKYYGWDNFTHEILIDGLTVDDANKWEEHYINVFNTLRPHGYNLTSGGLNAVRSEETKAKMSAQQRGKKLSEETIRRMIAGRKNYVVSEETRLKMSLARKNPSEETRKRMSLGQKNMDDDTKKRRSDAVKLAQTGKKRTPEQKAKMSESAKKHIRTAEHSENLKNAQKKLTPEQRAATGAKISASKKGAPRSKEAIAKAAATQTGSKRTPEQRARMSEAMKGKKRSPEGLANIRAAAQARAARQKIEKLNNLKLEQ